MKPKPWLPALHALLAAAASAATLAAPPRISTPSPVPDVHAVTVTQAMAAEDARLPCYQGVRRTPCDLRIYQIMVESFIDGDAQANYGTGYGTSHHRGDLQGVLKALDYIQGLGMNTIWLTPIFTTRGGGRQNEWTSMLDATGYYATDYFQVDRKFGGDAQFRALVAEVHRRGMYILLDGVFGHYKNNIVASPSGLRPVNAEKCRAGERERDHYPDSTTRQACADYSAPETLAFFSEVARYWIENYHIDGWRLDQAYQVPLEHWRTLRDVVASSSARTRYLGPNGRPRKPLGYMVAEISWRRGTRPIYNETAYGTTEDPALESAFEFDVHGALLSTLAMDDASGRSAQPATALAEGFHLFDDYPAHAMPNLMLGNHDIPRFGDLIQRAGHPGPEHDSYWQRHELAFAFMAAFSGPVTVYYGQETGQEVADFAARVEQHCASVGLCDDHVARSNGKIDGLNERETALYARVRQLMQWRQQHAALSVGSRQLLHADAQLYLEVKRAGKSRILLAMNTGSQPARVTLAQTALPEARTLRPLDSSQPPPLRRQQHFELQLPPLSARFYSF